MSNHWQPRGSGSRNSLRGPSEPSGAAGGFWLGVWFLDFLCLAGVHLRGGGDTDAAYHLGQVIGISVLATGFVAVIARVGELRWKPWQLGASVLGVSALLYALVVVLPAAADDASATPQRGAIRHLIAE